MYYTRVLPIDIKLSTKIKTKNYREKKKKNRIKKKKMHIKVWKLFKEPSYNNSDSSLQPKICLFVCVFSEKSDFMLKVCSGLCT